MESISKLFNVVILVFGIFFVATYLGAAQEDRVLEEHVTAITTNFADTVRKQGKITKKMYNDMVSELDALGILFHIEMVYNKDIITPVTAGVTTTTQESYYTSEIIAGIFNGADSGGAYIDGKADGEVHFNQDDTFYVHIRNRSDTLRQRFAAFLPFVNGDGYELSARAGGLVRDENWSDN